MLVRSIYYDGYRCAGKPERIRSREELIAKHLEQTRPLGADEAARAVFKVLHHHLAPGEMAEMKQNLPQDIRMLFPFIERTAGGQDSVGPYEYTPTAAARTFKGDTYRTAVRLAVRLCSRWSATPVSVKTAETKGLPLSWTLEGDHHDQV
jgi:hypothetical protein